MGPALRRPWSFVAAVTLFILGFTVLLSAVGARSSLWLTAGALLVAAVVELAGGFELQREGATWIAQVFSGGIISFLALFMLGLPPLVHRPVQPASIAMMLGIYCLGNGLFRAADLWADHPRARIAEAVNAVLTLVLSAALIEGWRDAALWQVAIAAGLVLLSSGAAIVDAAWAARRHPAMSAYDDLAAAVMGIKNLEAKVEGYDVETDEAARHDLLPS